MAYETMTPADYAAVTRNNDGLFGGDGGNSTADNDG